MGMTAKTAGCAYFQWVDDKTKTLASNSHEKKRCLSL
jgi:hypothetical protein